jgi:competence protein ComEA
VVLAVVSMAAMFLLFERFHETTVIPDPPASGARAGEITGKLDPNTATAADLSAIPTLGEKRAAEIVTYRDEFLHRHPGTVVFKSPNDLLGIKGIGVGTVHNMEPYLVFPETKK